MDGLSPHTMPARIGYRVVQVSSEEEGYRGSQLVETGPQAKGWLAAKYCIYPQSVVLALDHRTTVDKLQIMGQPWAVTTSLEIWIGDVPKGSDVEVSKAYFMKVGEFPMESNEDNDFTARQLQCVEISQGAKPIPVSFVKFVLHKNYQNRKNQYNQVGLAGVNVIGTPKVNLVGGSASVLKSPLDGSDVLSDYDDLSFLMYTDREVAQIISKLEKKKLEAVNTERFEYAKKIKTAIGEIQEAGLILGSLEMEKQILADSQDYDEAKEKKIQMDEFRVEVYKTLEITDLLELQGLNTQNDRPGGRNRDRLKPLLPIVTRNRRSLAHMISGPPPPPPPPTNPPSNLPPHHDKDLLRSASNNVSRDRTPSPSASPREPSPPPIPSPLPSPPTPPREPKLQKKRDNSKVSDKDHPKLISAVEVFTETLVAKCLSKNVPEKLEAITEFKSQVENYSRDSGKPGKFFKASSELLLFLLDSSIWNAFKSACEITGSLFDRVVGQHNVPTKILTDSTKSIFRKLLLKSGEPTQRVHDLAIDTGVRLVKSPKMEELDVLDALLTEKITNKEPPKVALSRVKFTQFLVQQYGISDERDDPMCVARLAKFGVEGVQHQDPEVRQAGQELLLVLYKVDQEAVRAEMPEDNYRTRRSHAMKYVFEQMDDYDRRHGKKHSR